MLDPYRLTFFENLPSGGKDPAPSFASFPSLFHASGEVVDRNRHRDVLRLAPLEDGRIPFLKRFHAKGRRGGFSLAEAESTRIRRFEGLGFPGPGCAAIGGRPHGEGLLLFLAPAGAVSLSDFLEARSSEDRRGLMRRLGREIGRIHRAGVRLPDLGARHVMVRPDGGHYFIDLARVRFGARLRRGAEEDLARLSATLSAASASRADRFRFLMAYYSSFGAEPANGPILHRSARRIFRLETFARCRGKFPQTARLREAREGKARLYVDRRFEAALRSAGLAGPEAFRNPGDAARLLRDLGVRRNYRVQTESAAFYLKVHREAALRRARSRSKGRREWENHLRMARIGVPAPCPAAWGEGPGFSFFLSLACEGPTAENLARSEPEARPGRRRAFLEALARRVRRMHACGLFHRDLYLCHVLDDEGIPTILDLQRLAEHPLFPAHRRLKDLAALLYSSLGTRVSRADRLRFLLVYLGKRRLDPEARRWIARAQRKAERIGRHDASRRRGGGR